MLLASVDRMPPTDDQMDPSRDPGRDLERGPAGEPAANATDPARRGTVPPASIGRAAARHRRTVGWRSRDVVRVAALVLAMYLVTRLIWFANALFLTLFLGVLFGIAVSAGVDRLQRLRVPRGVGAALIVVTFFGLLGGVGAWVAPTLRVQGKELQQRLPLAVDRLEEWLNRQQGGVFGLLVGGGGDATHSATADSGRGAPAQAAPVAGATVTPAAPRGVASPTPADSVSPRPGSTLRERLASKLSGATRYLFPFLTGTIQAVGGLLLIVFLSIYFAADPDLYRRGALALLPPRRRVQGAEVIDRVAMVLRKWLVTQLIAMAVIGTVSTTALLILHVKAAFVLGLLAGLFEFIPTVGPILSAIPAIAMAFLDSPEKAVLVIAVYVAIQFLENHILIPLLMKGGMDLPPALTVLTQALLALVFGFLGLMVAVPMLATVMVLVQMLYVERDPEEPPLTRRPFDPDLDEPLGGLALRSG
jgi:predicted PurR-regulated permease PerM